MIAELERLFALCKTGDKVRQSGDWCGATAQLRVDRTAIKCGDGKWFWDLDSNPPTDGGGMCITERKLAEVMDSVPLVPSIRRWRAVVGGEEIR